MIKLNKEIFKYFNLLGTIGLVIISNIIFAVIFYKVIEKFFIKSTMIFIVLILIGIINGFYCVYKMILKK